MISAVSNQIVADLGKGSLSPLNGISQINNINPLSVLVEKTPRNFFAGKQYKAFEYHFSDVLAENTACSDALKSPDIVSPITIASSYSKVRDVSLGTKLSVQICNALPSLKATAKASGGISMRITTGCLIMKTIDEKVFEKAMRQGTLNKDHSLVKFLLTKKKRSLCVIKSVLVTQEKTEIVCTSKYGGHAEVSAKVVGQGGSVSADIDSLEAGRVVLEAGIVLACRWQRMTIDKTTLSITQEITDDKKNRVHLQMAPYEPYHERYNSLDSLEEFDLQLICSLEEEVNPSNEKVRISDADAKVGDENITSSKEKETKSVEETDESTEEENESDEEENRDEDWILHDIYDARKDQIRRFKTAIGIVMKSTGDIEALSDMCVEEEGEEEEFRRNLQNTDEVLSLLKLMGYKIRNNYIRHTSRGPFAALVPAVVEAMTVFDVEDLELIRKCNSYQKKNILRIIKATDDHKEFISIDSKFLQELQNEPVGNIVALLDVEIDFPTGKVLLPSTSGNAHYALKYLLYSL